MITYSFSIYNHAWTPEQLDKFYNDISQTDKTMSSITLMMKKQGFSENKSDNIHILNFSHFDGRVIRIGFTEPKQNY